MDRYKTIKTIGDGSFGSVMQALDTATGELVAIKRMKQKYASWEECIKLREVKSLRKLLHPNIVRLKELIRESSELCFVFEYMEHNLYQVMKDRHQARMEGRRVVACDDCGCSREYGNFCEDEIRWLIFQVLCGLAYMQKKGFYHRDMKPENLLITGLHVKIGDFGLAREIKSRPPYTDYVSTRWYRAPEVILRSPHYSSPIDIWALGCILAELFTNRPLFPGSGEIDQVRKICAVLGTPGKSSYRVSEGGGGEWFEGVQLAQRLGLSLPHARPKLLSTIVPNASQDALHLMRDMLQFDPSKRPSPQAALQYPFFHPITKSRVPQTLLSTLRPLPSPTGRSSDKENHAPSLAAGTNSPRTSPRGSIVLNGNFEIVKGQVDVRCMRAKQEPGANWSYSSGEMAADAASLRSRKGHVRAATNAGSSTADTSMTAIVPSGTGSARGSKRGGSTKRRRSTLRNSSLDPTGSGDRPRVLTRVKKGKQSPQLSLRNVTRKSPSLSVRKSRAGKKGATVVGVPAEAQGEGREVNVKKVSRAGSLRMGWSKASTGLGRSKAAQDVNVQRMSGLHQLHSNPQASLLVPTPTHTPPTSSAAPDASFMSQISETQSIMSLPTNPKRISVPLPIVVPLKETTRRPSVPDTASAHITLSGGRHAGVRGMGLASPPKPEGQRRSRAISIGAMAGVDALMRKPNVSTGSVDVITEVASPGTSVASVSVASPVSPDRSTAGAGGRASAASVRGGVSPVGAAMAPRMVAVPLQVQTQLPGQGTQSTSPGSTSLMGSATLGRTRVGTPNGMPNGMSGVFNVSHAHTLGHHTSSPHASHAPHAPHAPHSARSPPRSTSMFGHYPPTHHPPASASADLSSLTLDDMTARKSSPTVSMSGMSSLADTSIMTVAGDGRERRGRSKMGSLRISRIPVRKNREKEGKKEVGEKEGRGDGSVGTVGSVGSGGGARRPSLMAGVGAGVTGVTGVPGVAGVEESKIPVSQRRQTMMQQVTQVIHTKSVTTTAKPSAASKLPQATRTPSPAVAQERKPEHARSKSIASSRLVRPPRNRSTTASAQVEQLGLGAPARWGPKDGKDKDGGQGSRARLSGFMHRPKEDGHAHGHGHTGKKVVKVKDGASLRNPSTWTRRKADPTQVQVQTANLTVPASSLPSATLTETAKKRMSLREDTGLFDVHATSFLDAAMPPDDVSPASSRQGMSPGVPQVQAYTTKPDDVHDSGGRKLIGKLKHIRTMSLSLVQKRTSGPPSAGAAAPHAAHFPASAHPGHAGFATATGTGNAVPAGYVHQKASVWESWIATATARKPKTATGEERARSSMSSTGVTAAGKVRSVFKRGDRAGSSAGVPEPEPSIHAGHVHVQGQGQGSPVPAAGSVRDVIVEEVRRDAVFIKQSRSCEPGGMLSMRGATPVAGTSVGTGVSPVAAGAGAGVVDVYMR